MLHYEPNQHFDLKAVVSDLLKGSTKARKFGDDKYLDFTVILKHIQKKYPEERVTKKWLTETLFPMLPSNTDVPRIYHGSKWAVVGGRVAARFACPTMNLGCLPSAKARNNPKYPARPKSFTYCSPVTMELASFEDVDDCWGMVDDIKDCPHVIDVVLSDLAPKYKELMHLGLVFVGRTPTDCRFVTFADAKIDHPSITVKESDEGLSDSNEHSWVAMKNLREDGSVGYAEDHVYQKFKNDEAFRTDVMDIFCTPKEGRKHITKVIV